MSIRKLFRIDAVLARWPTIRLLHAKDRGVGHRPHLPPGRLDSSDRWRTDQMFFAKMAASLGPVFKTAFHGYYATCLVGHKRAQELLNTQENALLGCDIELRHLFPKGSIRAMSGEDHRQYRRIFIQALKATPVAFHEEAIRGCVRAKLAALANDYSGTPVPGPEFRLCLREMTTEILLRILFGLPSNDPQFPVIVHNYRRFGPIGYEIAPEQAEAFFAIRNQVQCFVDTIRRDPHGWSPSLLKAMIERDELDETALGNLIFTFERSHFDMYSLWHWIVKHLVSNPDYIKRVQNAAASARPRLYEAAVLESLRLEQVEYLNRTVISDIWFQHYLIPKGTHLRVCLWEGHKDPKIFPDPLRFDPERFIGRTFTIEEYAPFGLDKRHCIASDLVVKLSTMFVETLLEQFVVTSASDGPPEFGLYHWEPNRNFSVVVSRVE